MTLDKSQLVIEIRANQKVLFDLLKKVQIGNIRGFHKDFIFGL